MPNINQKAGKTVKESSKKQNKQKKQTNDAEYSEEKAQNLDQIGLFGSVNQYLRGKFG